MFASFATVQTTRGSTWRNVSTGHHEQGREGLQSEISFCTVDVTKKLSCPGGSGPRLASSQILSMLLLPSPAVSDHDSTLISCADC